MTIDPPDDDGGTIIRRASQPPHDQDGEPERHSAENDDAIGAQPEVGTVLNDLYSLTRFIRSGGMGEVWEGVNTRHDVEKVAIKFIKRKYSDDEVVLSAFKYEANQLNKCTHEAIVRYRFLTREPILGRWYLAMAFVDGESLLEQLGKIDPTSENLKALIRRLAEGLSAAHRLGVIHRDISPDNVLLPGGDLSGAVIIDFGIAKDVKVADHPLSNQEFIGKRSFAAPEQFPQFGKQIGPWTDVYSLGLLALSVAAGHIIDMGRDDESALEHRRAAPDLSKIPVELRPLLSAMLVAEPADRLRSMQDVLARLDPSDTADPRRSPPPLLKKWRLPAFVAATVIVVVGLFVAWPRQRAEPHAPPPPPRADLRAALLRRFSSVPCTWLLIDRLEDADNAARLTLSGLSPAAEAGKAVTDAERSLGRRIDLEQALVLEPAPTMCEALDAVRPFGVFPPPEGRRLSTAAANYTLQMQPDGKVWTRDSITLAIGNPAQDFVLFAMDARGVLLKITDRSSLTAALAAGNRNFTDNGGDRFTLSAKQKGPPEVTVYLLLTGEQTISTDLLTQSQHSAEWARAVGEAGRQGHWSAEMVSYMTTCPTQYGKLCDG